MTDKPIGLNLQEFTAARKSELSGRERYEAAQRGDFDRERLDRDRQKLDYLAGQQGMGEDLLNLVTNARDYTSSGAALPDQVRQLIGLDQIELPQAQPPASTPKVSAAPTPADQPVIQVAGAQPPAQPVGMGGWTQAQAASIAPVTNAEHYGMTQEQWDALDPWQRLSMRAFGSNVTGAAATGAIAGVEGGLPGMAIGAVAGTLLGSAAERFPVLQKVFDALDIAGRTYKKAVGVGELGRLALKNAMGQDTGVTYADLLQNLDDAWAAGEQSYRVMSAADWLDIAGQGAMMTNPAIGSMRTALEAWQKAGMIDLPDVGALAEKTLKSGEAWQFGTNETTTLKPEQVGAQALGEYFNRLKDIPAAQWDEAKAALDAEFQQRYGFQGDMRDLVGSIFLDPLNAAGTGTTALTRGIARATGAVDLAEAMKGAEGPTQGIKRFKTTAALKTFGDWQEMTGFEKFLSKAWTSEGTPALLENQQGKLKYGWTYMTNLTPEARAREFTGIASQNLAAVAEMAQAKPQEFLKMLDGIANNDMVAVRNLGAEFFGGAEMASVVPMLRENLGTLRTMVDDFYRADTAGLRGMLDDIATRTGRSAAEVIDQLTDPAKADINARSMAANLGMEPEALKAAAETLKGAPLTETQLSAKMYSALIEGSAQFAVKYFNVKPESTIIRLSNLIKSTQGLFLLDLSPMYLANNVIDNTVKLAREGVVGYVTPEAASKFMSEFFGDGIIPTRLAESGLVGTDLAQAAGKQDAISLATRSTQGKIAKAQEAIGGIRSKTGVASKISGAAEQAQRSSAMVIGINKAWNSLWRPGVGFERMPGQLEQLLGTDAANRIYARIAGAKAGDITAGMLTDAAYSLDDAIADTATGMGKDAREVRNLLDGLGIGDTLGEKLKTASTPEQKRAAFAEVHQQVQAKLDEWHTSQLLAQAEKAANTAGAEGPLGAMRIFDEINQGYYDQRMADFDKWESLFEQRASKAITEEEFGKLVRQQMKENRQTYRRINTNAKAQYAGIAERLGMESQFGRTLAGNIADQDDAWAKFFDYQEREYSEFFRKSRQGKKGGFSFEEARRQWLEMQKRISAEYETTSTRITELTQGRDTMLIDMIRSKYGDAAGDAAVAWLDGVRNLEGEMRADMKAFQDRIAPMSSVERRAEWTRFLNEEHRPKMAKRLADNLEGSRRVYVAADDARRARGPLQQPPAPGEMTPAQTWVNEARRQKLYQMTGLDEAQQTAVMNARQMAAEYGIPSADEAGKPVSGFDKRLLATVKKYTGEEYSAVHEVPEDVLRRALENRLIEKGELIGPPAPVAPLPEPTPAEVNTLALELEDARLNQAMQGWTDSLPGKKRITPEAPAPIDPDPVGIAPPGTVDGLSPQPNLYQMFEEGWATEAAPLMRDLEAKMSAPREKVAAGLTPEQTKQLVAYLEKIKGQRAQAKLAATKYAEISVDTAMLNYNRRYGVDNFLNMAAPYQFWFTRTAMQWALTAIDRPAWFANYARIREMQDKLARPMEGFPSRLNGKMKIEIPFLPEGWGKSVYVDPWHNVFGFEGMAAQALRPLLRDFSNRRSRAEYILQEMASSGEVSEAQAAQALRMKSGALWDQAMQQAAGQVEAEIASPVDLAATMFAPSVPVKWALEAMGVMQGSRTQGNALAQISTMPSFATIQNVTSFMTPGGINLGEKLTQYLGAAENPNSAGTRGYLWDYYVARELSNMAAEGADVNAIKQAMVEKQGPLYTQAVDRVGKMQAVRSFSAMLWTDLFPEGEQQQRALKIEFEKAADAGKIGDFLDAHPEYEARMQMGNWDDPEGMMRQFLRGSVWDGWNKLSDLEKREVKDQLGDVFADAFLNKETHDYDSITTETLAQWARLFKGDVPANAPETPQAKGLDLPSAELSQAYTQYEALYDTPGYQAQKLMYSLPEGMRDQFAAQHPEIGKYQDRESIFLAQHPELIPYVIGEDNRMAGAPAEVQAEVYRYWGERAQKFPGISSTQDRYYSLSKPERKAFLKQHPELKAYWDWKEKAEKNLSGDAYYYAKGAGAVEKLAQGKDYRADYEPDVSGFSNTLTLEIARAALANGRLGSGAQRALKAEYAKQRPPVNYDDWLAMVMQQFTTY